MISILKNSLKITLIMLITSACNNGPKVIESTTAIPNSEKSSGIFSDEASTPSNMNTSTTFSDNMHSVKVNEILEASKYFYLNVTENDEQFWIATRTMGILVGETYYFKGGLLKTNYENKELSKVFEKIYLISGNLVAANHSTSSNSDKSIPQKKQLVKSTPVPIKTTSKKIVVEGSMKISELVANPSKYDGKTIQISGICVKSNPNIMNKNWMHLKDGSQDDYDLVITSDTFIPEGSIVTMTATVSLNKDFGAGYKYDLILENGVIIPQ
ncbi:GW dipeptide domain-containing protein [uncultured Lutibacter sp.]|uniref:GW dipeptide domain-containing protein n=1 Tax=uncultured Lutibacter sp. TaxID=437739 RepID=UPI002632827E|nr:GW dipeptide domain-containing protein [uncultured Lutibacter sp.]